MARDGPMRCARARPVRARRCSTNKTLLTRRPRSPERFSAAADSDPALSNLCPSFHARFAAKGKLSLSDRDTRFFRRLKLVAPGTWPARSTNAIENVRGVFWGNMTLPASPPIAASRVNRRTIRYVRMQRTGSYYG